VEKALRFLAEHERTVGRLHVARRAIVGSPATVEQGIRAAVAEYGADEVMILTLTYDHAARCRSYKLIAAAFAAPRLQDARQ
jgi:alkanesulfonate monooxygenase SsuD/methylene tetrahydromethanopterin reductase-like flavin-dependent oxidoreductase (luciferase family)